MKSKQPLDPSFACPHGNSALLLGFGFVPCVLQWVSGQHGHGTTFFSMGMAPACAASAAAPTWPWGWGEEKIRVFSRQGWDWKLSMCEECVTSPQLLVNISTTLWGLKSNLFTFSLLSRAFCRRSFILHCITYIKTRSEKILLGPFFLWLFVNFKALQDYMGKKSYFQPPSKMDSFLSPKCIKKKNK